MSEDQEIQIEDLSTEKAYFTMIPNIVLKMGLTPYELAYYIILKSIAGEARACFMSQKKIADLVGCSTRQLRKMNQILSSPFEILENKPLIKITYRKNELNGNMPNLIQIVDIWGVNMHVLQSKTPVSKNNKLGAESYSPHKNSKILDAEPYFAPPQNIIPHTQELSADKEDNINKKKNNNTTTPTPPVPKKEVEPKSNIGGGGRENLLIGDIIYRNMEGEIKNISQTEIFKHFLKLPFSTEVIIEAVEQMKESSDLIRNPLKYLEAICFRLSNSNKKELNKYELFENETLSVVKDTSNEPKVFLIDVMREQIKEIRAKQQNEK